MNDCNFLKGLEAPYPQLLPTQTNCLSEVTLCNNALLNKVRNKVICVLRVYIQVLGIEFLNAPRNTSTDLSINRSIYK